METFLHTQDLIEHVINQLSEIDLKGIKGRFYIDTITFTDISVQQNGQNIALKTTTKYGIIEKGKNKVTPLKKNNIMLLPNDAEFIQYVLDEFNELNFDNKVELLSPTINNYDYTKSLIRFVTKKELLYRFNIDTQISKVTSSNAKEEDVFPDLTYIEGSHIIKDALLKKELTIVKGTLTRDEVSTIIKKMNAQYKKYYRQEEEINKHKNYTPKQVACKRLAELMCLRITSKNGTSNIYLTGLHPAKIHEDNKEMIKFEVLMVTRYFLKYINKEITTKKELEDAIYYEHNEKKVS